MTRNVPCYTRAAAVGSVESESVVEGTCPCCITSHPASSIYLHPRAAGGVGSTAADDGWLAPSMSRPGVAGASSQDIPSMEPLPGDTTAEERDSRCGSDDSEVPDMCDAVAGASLEEEDECSLPYLRAREPEDNILRTRTYDVSMSYDKFYQTPRIWLTGYDERRQLLTASQALEDVSLEHARKTVTVDAHPHTGVAAVSIHPCRHAAVMKSLADQIARGGVEPQTEHFLLIFLRFCQTAMPTIDYDFTVNIGG